MSGSSQKKPQRKLTRKDIDKVGGGAALQETPKKTEEKPASSRSIGQPKKDDVVLQNIPITFYVNTQQLATIEANAQNDGFSKKDKAKWVKQMAINEEYTSKSELEALKVKLKSELETLKVKSKSEIEALKVKLEAKEEMIEMLKSMMKN